MPSGVYKRTQKTRQKMRLSHLGKFFSKETKKKMSKSHIGLNTWSKGKSRSEETRKKISERHKGRPRSKETKEKIRQGHIGKKLSEETKQKLRNSHVGLNNWLKGKFCSEETKEKIRQGHVGKKMPIEVKQKMSDAKVGKMPSCLNGIQWGHIKRGYYNINGTEIFFRSKMEANYALYLNFLVKQKQIKKWEYEKDVFIFEAIKFGVRSYRPDFKIYNLDKTIEYHEVKGYMDAKSKTKIKRMEKYYSDIKLIVIDNPFYQDLKRKIGKMLKFY